ncbi:unnamed protein product [Gongylonema pulchrum]|uniref:Transposase n=1 Tax=Gongylonema pulchrum TaxID=637853 RepID=A0A183D9F6_9BILA|nr:unnamed protein product [Gongylonema pulchrum]
MHVVDKKTIVDKEKQWADCGRDGRTMMVIERTTTASIPQNDVLPALIAGRHKHTRTDEQSHTYICRRH